MYWMLAAIAFAFGAAAIYALPPDNHIPRSLLFSKLRAFDWVGSALSTISATTLIFALSYVPPFVSVAAHLYSLGIGMPKQLLTVGLRPIYPHFYRPQLPLASAFSGGRKNVNVMASIRYSH